MTPRWLVAAAALWLAAAAGWAAGSTPRLEFHAPEGFERAVRSVASAAESAPFGEALQLTGLADFGDPIQVVLLAEDAPAAAEIPDWVSGYARPNRRLVVVLPDRVPSYPDRTMRSLLAHEVAHLLVWEAAGGRPVPRWFNEGVATVAAREWGVEDSARYALAAAGRRIRSVDELDRGFRGSGSEARRSYALSAAMVRWLRQEVDADVTARILRSVADGQPFDRAFFVATGMNLAAAERRFFSQRWFWAAWVPLLTSSTGLWLGITLLALLAIVRRVLKSREMHQRWELEEGGLDEPRATALPPPRPRRGLRVMEDDEEVVN